MNIGVRPTAKSTNPSQVLMCSWYQYNVTFLLVVTHIILFHELCFSFKSKCSCIDLSFGKSGVSSISSRITFRALFSSGSLLCFSMQPESSKALMVQKPRCSTSEKHFLNAWHHQEAIACTATVVRT